MTGWVIILHGIPTDVHVAIIGEHVCRIRHEGIWREEVAQFGVIVAGVVVHQAGGIQLLPREAVFAAEFMAAAVTTIGMVPFLPTEGAAAVAGGNGAAQVVAM